MKTTATPQSRRKSTSYYQNSVKRQEAQEAQALAKEEEHRLNAQKELKENSQKHIDGLCKTIQESYTKMVNAGKDMRQVQDELNDKKEEEVLFQKTADEIYSLKDVNEDDLPKMRLRRLAYYGLPLLDCVFAWFALSPIITAKAISLDFIVAMGVISSIILGLGLSLLSRLAVASLDNDRSIMRPVKILGVILSMFILPSMYIVSEVFFNGGESWTYSSCFAAVSFVIQLLIVTGYKSHVGAFNYFRSMKQNNKTKAAREADEKAIQEELKTLRGKIQSIITSFDAEYAKFTGSFRDLAIARDKHIVEFGEEARYYLNQLVIYIGDLVCFRREVIPLYYESNGAVSTIPFVDFPKVFGGHGIFTNSDFIYLDYMMQRGHTGVSLTETIRALSEQPYLEQNSSESDGDEKPDPFQQAEANDVKHDAPLDNESPDSTESDSNNKGIW